MTVVRLDHAQVPRGRDWLWGCKPDCSAFSLSSVSSQILPFTPMGDQLSPFSTHSLCHSGNCSDLCEDPSIDPIGLYPLPKTGCPKAGKVYRVPAKEARSLKSKCQWVHLLPHRFQEGQSDLVYSLVVPGEPWQVTACTRWSPLPSSHGFLFYTDPACLLPRPNSLDVMTITLAIIHVTVTIWHTPSGSSMVWEQWQRAQSSVQAEKQRAQ